MKFIYQFGIDGHYTGFTRCSKEQYEKNPLVAPDDKIFVVREDYLSEVYNYLKDGFIHATEMDESGKITFLDQYEPVSIED